ncbi:MAG: hypothetical protein ACI9T7_000104 [Oleiphilaceae bacterium]|jgi:hypothetical protein
MSKTTIKVSVALSEDEKTATVRMGSRRQPIVTGCLGVDRNQQGGIDKVYLDSLIHLSSKYVDYEGFQPQGAISTILKCV